MEKRFNVAGPRFPVGVEGDTDEAGFRHEITGKH